MAATLDGVRLKIDRSEKHLNEFHAAFQSGPGVATHVTLVSIEEHPEGRRVTGAITSGDLPPDLGAPLGDAVHNLRSSLDHLICQLAVASGNHAACDRTQFPIFAEDTPDNRKRIERWIRHISPAAQTEIKALQPYQRRPADAFSDLLWLVSELDNIDKHRLLLVARPHFRKMLLSFTIDGDTRSVIVSDRPEWQPLKFGTEPLRFRMTVPWDITKPETKVEVKAEPIVGVVFQQTGLKCDGWEIFPTIRDMIADVKGIVDNFAGRFF